MNFDVIVIGSGFGGAIGGCRLAEAGYKVLHPRTRRRWDKITTLANRSIHGSEQ
jgi:cholesterol oxidase